MKKEKLRVSMCVFGGEGGVGGGLNISNGRDAEIEMERMRGCGAVRGEEWLGGSKFAHPFDHPFDHAGRKHGRVPPVTVSTI